MKELEYIIVIDFGTTNTKLKCWNINKDIYFPVYLGKQYHEGLLPTATEYNGKFYANFFNRPSCMKQVGDMPIFSCFAKKLFGALLKNNPFLSCIDRNDPWWNFLIVISYPSMWDHEDGYALLHILQQLLPAVRYAIREDIAYRELCANKEEPHLIIDMGAGKTVVYDGQSAKVIYSYSEHLIESKMVEKAMMAFNQEDTNGMNPKLVNAIREEDFVKTEYLLKCIKEDVQTIGTSKESPNGIEEQWCKDSIKELSPNAEVMFRKIKSHIGTDTSISFSGGESYHEDVLLNSIFSNAKEIRNWGLFGVCDGMINYFKRINEQVSELHNELSAKIQSESCYSTFNTSTYDLVSKTIVDLWKAHGKEILNEYVERWERTSYEDYIQDITAFVNNILPQFYTENIIDNLSVKFMPIINEVSKECFENMEFDDFTDEYVPNKIEKYMVISLSPFLHNYNKLRSDLINYVFEKCHDWQEANLTKPREDKDRRRRAYNQLWKFLDEYKIINSTPKISWVVLANKNIMNLYMLDTFCLNCKTIDVIPFVPMVQEMDLARLQNVINFAFNQIVDEGLNDIYRMENDKLVYHSESKVANWETFDFNTYVEIFNIINDKVVNVDFKQLKVSKKISGKFGLTAFFESKLSKDCPHIFTKLNTFFNLDITPSSGTWSFLSDNIDNIYKKAINKFLYFDKI